MLPSTMRQKILQLGFWGLLIYVAITSTVVIAIQFQLIPVSEKSLAKEEQVTKPQTDLPSLSEISFAKLFAREYLSWTKGQEESRMIRLEPFWSDGIDKQGGMKFEQAEWNSYPQNVEVWKVENRSGSKGIKEVTVYAETILTKVDNSEAQKRMDRYMIIPIKKSGASFRVVDIPYFIAPPVANKLPKPKQNEKDSGEPVNESVRQDVENFLQSFWNSYTKQSPKEISYLMKNNPPQSTLAGIFDLVSLENVEVFKKGNYYHVKNDVVLKDLATGIHATYHYRLELVNEKNRWFILKIEQGEVS